MNLLIITRTGDLHAIAVATSAALHGHRVALWAPPEVVDEAVKASVSVDSFSVQWNVGETSHDEGGFDVVWLRRTHAPRAPDNAHPDDLGFIARENREFFGMLWAAVSPRASWIHDYGACRYGENKIFQLCAARKVGLCIPDTLFSQDAERIRRFVIDIERKGGQAIYKTFSPAAWQGHAAPRIKETTVVCSSVLSTRKSLWLVPGIYQRRIEKHFELRVNLLGDKAITIAIDSQADARGCLDWRGICDFKDLIRPFDLPEDIRQKCVALLSEMGLAMGCIDMIVDKDGGYHFLEVNQQGQFLWIEEACPEVRLLDAFVHFLSQRVKHSGAMPSIQYKDVIASELYEHATREFSGCGYVALP